MQEADRVAAQQKEQVTQKSAVQDALNLELANLQQQFATLQQQFATLQQQFAQKGIDSDAADQELSSSWTSRALPYSMLSRSSPIFSRHNKTVRRQVLQLHVSSPAVHLLWQNSLMCALVLIALQ